MSSIPDPSGEALRDEAISRLAYHRPDLVRELGQAAVQLALTRPQFTADDIRELVTIPDGIRPQVVGAAVRPLAVAGIIRQVGYQRSVRPIAHCRPLAVWQLGDSAAASAWLASHPVLTTDGGSHESD